MFTVSCENDCIEGASCFVLHYSDSIVSVNGMSQIEVGVELECQLELFYFCFSEETV